MIAYSEYLDEYTADLNTYLHKIKHLIYNIKNKQDYNKIREYITESEKCIKQITVETNSLPKGSHKIFEEINKYNSDLKKYKNILEKMDRDYYSEINDREYDLAKKYIEGTNFLDESERRAQDVEDMGYTIMSELTSQRATLLKTKRHVDETRHEQSRIKRIMLSIYNNKIIYKYLLIVIIILLAIANVGVIIYKIRR
ncbi:vesicle transport v-SNARE protein, putative [Plasmodium berghei]|uniref:Vesicle transport v-SNARE protein, putative n=2 Tax=Plasmodium berghei TaxID=5821 RepID=A0A509AF52_PLABA|nr:vesicle transport v-SNARE protein, putative [Plasmodium berghei ANKA]CXI02878.1 vesicle transport v-SNARE protein, putative [Plasmodium berghei]SCL92024.1 vesicle transport v-SNARE protein, putative [Plasmodium berghei]SCM15578.1 vesicle transport v-SNARE protein, putative [Plasmodium berghei]SCM17370.1 vesicle transport v-SNARE protein, putative [Plasmodium berghei]SCN22616.1 vesicle transport v-SNARE protein, putative [Plasmodium berghei]|eukprot:XP_034420176.1 vesicle transport v-SNARE protein, putative [Plasmodium berghei ANKA]